MRSNVDVHREGRCIDAFDSKQQTRLALKSCAFLKKSQQPSLYRAEALLLTDSPDSAARAATCSPHMKHMATRTQELLFGSGSPLSDPSSLQSPSFHDWVLEFAQFCIGFYRVVGHVLSGSTTSQHLVLEYPATNLQFDQ
jgi:hypothetical protein